MDQQKSDTQVNRERSSREERGKGDNKGALKRRVATEAISKEGGAIGSMVIQADNVTMTLNFNF